MVWTGGSNIPAQQHLEPMDLGCFHLTEYKFAHQVKDDCTKGIAEEQWLQPSSKQPDQEG